MPYVFFFSFIFISWRLITLQYCSGFCHTLTWISHGFTCIPHPDPPSHLPLYPIPLGLSSAPGPSTCLMHPTWAGDLFHPYVFYQNLKKKINCEITWIRSINIRAISCFFQKKKSFNLEDRHKLYLIKSVFPPWVQKSYSKLMW